VRYYHAPNRKSTKFDTYQTLFDRSSNPEKPPHLRCPKQRWVSR